MNKLHPRNEKFLITVITFTFHLTWEINWLVICPHQRMWFILNQTSTFTHLSFYLLCVLSMWARNYPGLPGYQGLIWQVDWLLYHLEHNGPALLGLTAWTKLMLTVNQSLDVRLPLRFPWRWLLKVKHCTEYYIIKVKLKLQTVFQSIFNVFFHRPLLYRAAYLPKGIAFTSQFSFLSVWSSEVQSWSDWKIISAYQYLSVSVEIILYKEGLMHQP